MLRIDLEFICHRLSISSVFRPIAQRRRKLGEEKRRVSPEETKKLLIANFICEIQFLTWLANVVMVKKASGKWRMCTDYTDLNKACPKDPYPLPSIDCLMDEASGFALLSYNKIKMQPQDEAKIAFIMDAGAYCYKVMPFRLKNAGETYQHMMDRMFEGMIGADVELYMDDMVVNSTSAADYCKALRRVFQILRKHQLKLNLEKCSFGVQAGKFLGFMLIERGIKANQKNVRPS
ncbi:hypothetical protein CR513_25422, partial [Mucuna pruriens]